MKLVDDYVVLIPVHVNLLKRMVSERAETAHLRHPFTHNGAGVHLDETTTRRGRKEESEGLVRGRFTITFNHGHSLGVRRSTVDVSVGQR